MNIGLIILVAAVAVGHLFQLGSIPPGLSNDEANIGYEAWSIATTGRDQWGNFLPVVFEGFGNWSLPVYIYATAPFVGIFGPTIPAVRLVSALSYVAIVLAVVGIMKQLRPQLALPAAAMTAATPWIYGLTRVANEVPLAMAFFLLAVYFFLLARRKRTLIVFSFVSIMLAMLTYYGIWVLAVSFAILFGYLHYRRGAFTNATFIALPVVFMLGAVFMYQASAAQRGNARLAQVNLTTDRAIVGELNAHRGVCNTTFSPLVCRLVFNKPMLFTGEFVSNYLSHFSVREWFITSANKGILPPGGYFLAIQVPLLLAGLWVVLSRGSALEKGIFAGWLVIAPLADSITGPGNFTRAFLIAPAVPVLSAYALLILPKLLTKAVLGLFVLAWLRFQLAYLSYFPTFQANYTHYEYLPLMQQLGGETKPIFLSSRYRDTKQYVFYLFYQGILPRDFQRNQNVLRETDADKWVWVKQIDNWNFVKSLPAIGDLPRQSLLVGATKEEIQPFISRYELCSGVLLGEEMVINYPNGDPVFSIVPVIKDGGDIVCQN